MWAACVALAALSATADLDQLLAQAAAAKARGAWAESLASMERAHAIHPAPELMNNIGWLLETLGRYRDAAAAYRRVVDDGSASPELRALDRERLEVLSPKLDRGHLVVDARPGGAAIFAAGAAIDAGAERSFDPGRCPIELRRVGANEVVLRWTTLRAGERTTFAEDLAMMPDADGRILLAALEPRPEVLEVDGVRVASPLSEIRTLRLAAGPHRVAIVRSGAPSAVLDLAVPARATLDLASQLAPLAAELVPPAGAGDAGAGPWPLVLAGAGVLLAGGAAVLFVAAGSDRDRVLSAPLAADGSVIGLTYAEAGRLESSANDKATAGAAMIGVGAAAAGAGLLWWLLSAR